MTRRTLAGFIVAGLLVPGWSGAEADVSEQEYERVVAEAVIDNANAAGTRHSLTRTVEPWSGGLWAATARQCFARGEFQKAKQVLLSRQQKWGDWADHTLINSALKDVFLAEKGAIRADCGAAALSHLLAMNGHAVSERELDKVIRQGRETASLLDLAGVSRRRGLWSEGVTIGLDLAGELKGPWIAYLDVGHFVLVTSVASDHLVVVESDGVTRDYTAEAFSQKWSGNALVFDRSFIARHPDLKLDQMLMAQLVGGCDVPADGCGEPVAAGGGNDNGAFNTGQAQHDQGKPACPKWRLNLSRLNLILEDTDIAYRTIGPPLAISRTYNADSTYLDLFGRKWMWSYGTKVSAATGSGVVVAYPSGKLVGFNWTGSAYYATDGSHDTLTANADGTFSLYRKDEGLTYSYQPIAAGGRLTSTSDRNGNTLTVTWLPDRVEITDAVGRRTTCQIQGGRIAKITDPAGRTASFAYNGDDLTASTDPAGVTSTYTYDAQGYVTSTTVPSRGVTQFTYLSDSRGKWLYQVLAPDGTYRQYFLNPSVMVQDEKGKLSYYTNEKYNNQVWRNTGFTDSLNRKYIYAYTNPDTPALPTQIQDPRGAISHFAYDPRGNLASATDPLGRTVSATYDAADNPLTITDALSRTTAFEYDNPDRGNVTRVINALGQCTGFTYDARGMLTSTTDARGNTTSYSYDSYANLESATDAEGNSSYYQHDTIGNLISATDAMGNVTSYDYDELGRVISVTKAGGARVSFEYGVADLLSVTDENGNATRYEYDHYGKLRRSIDAKGGVTTTAYDPSGNIAAISDALGHTTSYTYDDINRLTLVKYADGTNEAFSYDSGGFVTARRDGNGVTTAYAYDIAGRLTSVSAPGLGARYTYDAVGNLSSVRDGLGLTRFAHDELGRVIRVTDPFGRRCVYGYDEAGNRAWMRSPYGLTTYTYDAMNRPVALNCPWNTTYFEFDANGNRIGMYDAVRRAIYAYDSQGRIKSVRNVKTDSGEVITSHQYTYDLVGNPRTAVEHDGSRSFYGYDVLNRLVSETRRGGVAPYNYRYAYDAVGNRLTMTDLETGLVTAYLYDAANKMLSAGGAAFTYDNNGNTIAKTGAAGITRYYWDATNRLIRVDVPGLGTVRYSYDAFGQRLKRTTPAGTTAFMFDPLAAIPGVIGTSQVGGVTTYLLTPSGFPVAEANPAMALSYAFSASGSVAGSITAAGSPGPRASYDAWGNGVGPGGLSPRGYHGASGYWADDQVDLVLAGARWYDPSAGRFLSPDTVVDPVGRQYQYVQNRPGVYTDPSGNVPVLILLAPGIIGSAVGLGATFVADVVRNAPTHGMNVFDYGWSSGGTYAGSVVGGFTGGMVGFYSKNPWLGGAAGGASGNIVQQAIDNRGFRNFDVGSLAVDTVVSTVASGVAREWIPRGPGRPVSIDLGGAYWGGLAQRYWKRVMLANVLKRLMKVPFGQSPGSCAPVLQGDFYSLEERLDMGLAIAL